MESKAFLKFSKLMIAEVLPKVPILGLFSFDKARQVDQFRCWVFGIDEQFTVNQVLRDGLPVIAHL